MQNCAVAALYHFCQRRGPLICIGKCIICTLLNLRLVPETGIEPVRPLFTKRRILSPMCLPISPLGPKTLLLNPLLSATLGPAHGIVKQKAPSTHCRRGLFQKTAPRHYRKAVVKAGPETQHSAGSVSGRLWRRDPESNWARWICNPLHNRFAIAPDLSVQKREAVCFPFFYLEREKSLELSTSTLARLRSTN